MLIPAFLRELNIYSVVLRLLLALLFSGILGIERGRKGRAAGFRTYMLVGLGSALVMITNQYISGLYPSDPARFGAQVISGIGFLGAGTIIVTSHNQVKGLTTAAGLWACACLGLAAGIGFYEGAVIASVLVFFVVTGLHRADRAMMLRARNLDIYLELKPEGQLSDFFTFAHKQSISVDNMEFTRSKLSHDDPLAFLISLRLPKRYPHSDALEQFRGVTGVSYVEEI